MCWELNRDSWHSDFANSSVGTRAAHRTTSTLVYTHGIETHTIEQHSDLTHDRKTVGESSRH